MRIWPLALAVAASLSLLAACGGGKDEADEQDGADSAAATAAVAGPAIATSSPTPDLGVGTPTGCVPQEDITSYRVTMVMGSEGGDGGGTTGDFLDDGFPIPGESTTELLFVAPDRWSMTFGASGQEPNRYIAIGPRVWLREAGSTDWEEGLPSDDLSFSDWDFCEAVSEDTYSNISGLQGQKETINGIASVHYVLPESPLGLVGNLFGDMESTHEVWLAEDGNWPVRLVHSTAYEVEGEHLSTHTFWEVSDLNDPAIVIEPPTWR